MRINYQLLLYVIGIGISTSTLILTSLNAKKMGVGEEVREEFILQSFIVSFWSHIIQIDFVYMNTTYYFLYLIYLEIL